MTLQEQIISAIDQLWLDGDRVNLHNVWLQTTYDYQEVLAELHRMLCAKIIYRDDNGNYVETSEITPKGGQTHE